MQTIWNRAAQVRACCACPKCLASVGGVSRRATASMSRRFPRYFLSSTFTYSSIFAAAATIDAGIKQKRRDQWDRAIAEVTQELERGGRAGQQQTERDDNATLASTRIELDAEADDDLLYGVDPERPRAQMPTNTGPPLIVHRLPPQSIYAAYEMKERASYRQWSPKKLATMELSIDLLQVRVFLELQARGWSAEAAQSVPENYRRRILCSEEDLISYKEQGVAMVRTVRKAHATLFDYEPPKVDFEIPQYSQDGNGHFLTTIRHLNSSLQELFDLYRDQTISAPALLAKLMYNLSISSAPPNLDTYNTLVLGLRRAQLHRFNDYVIESLRNTSMRVNEVSLAAVLKHFTDTDNVNSFIWWTEMVLGKHNGLSLARPGIVINDAGRSRLMRHPDNPDKVIQLPYPTPKVFAVLLLGVVKFGGFDTALQICRDMGKQGWGLCMYGAEGLLRDCADRGDWDSGMAVWRQIQDLKSQSGHRWNGRWLTERIRLTTFAAMLRLSVRCDRRQMYDQVWLEALKAHRSSVKDLPQLVKKQCKVA